MGISIWHLLVVVIVVFLLFGKGRVSGMMEDIAKGIKSFKKGLADDDAGAAPSPQEPHKRITDQTPPRSFASESPTGAVSTDPAAHAADADDLKDRS